MTVSITQIASSWHRYAKFKRSEDSWAYVKVREIIGDERKTVSNQTNLAWQIVLCLISLAPSRKALFLVTAGPLRELLNGNFDKYIELVRTEVSTNPRLAYSLTQISVDNESHFEQLYQLGNRAAYLIFAAEDEFECNHEVTRQADNWLRHHRNRDEAAREQLHRLDSEIQELCLTDPHKCWDVIQGILSKSITEEELLAASNNLALLLELNFEAFWDDIQVKAPANFRLSFALEQTYKNLNDQTQQERLRKLLDSCRDDNPLEH